MTKKIYTVRIEHRGTAIYSIRAENKEEAKDEADNLGVNDTHLCDAEILEEFEDDGRECDNDE